MLLRVVGLLLIIEAAFMVIPMLAGLFYSEGSTVKFLICIGITAGAGAAMVGLKPKYRDMGKRDAFLLTAMIWVILSLFGMLPFLLCRTHLSVTDAFFETMSGFTTTGASVLNTLNDVPRSIIIWRCVIQWVGGLGIILFTLAVVPMLNYQGGMQLFNAEVTGITHDKLRPRVSFTAKGLWGVYIVLTALLVVLLSFSKMDFFDSLCYGLSTMSTGGFSTSDMNLDHFESNYIKIVMSIFMFIGGVNFALLYNMVMKRQFNLWRNDAFRWYVWIIVICYGLFCINVTIEGLVLEPADLTIDPLFQAISILSSTGITEPDFDDWGALSTLVLIVMMFMGACAGSTSGGAKIDRFIILFRFLKNEFYKLMHPSTVTTVTINRKGISSAIVNKTLAFLFIYAV
ncbi:MAG: TrkH family potassium uptake protein, partial [Muribaculaceae bacterium]|nr:TrkH family potassium uptake protein [Muribaculaceae bacterium]